MRCKKCGSYSFKVTNTVKDDDLNVIRRRQCKECGTPIITLESVVDYSSIYEATGDYSRKIKEVPRNEGLTNWFKNVISILEEEEKKLPKEEH